MRLAEFGSLLLAVAAALSCLASLLSLSVLRRLVPAAEKLPRILAFGSFSCVTVAFVILVWISVLPDFTYRYVWEHSSADLDLIYRLSSVWAGGAGSVLLCTWMISLVLMIETFVRAPSRSESPAFRRAFASLMSLLITFFSYTAFVSDPFDRTDLIALGAYPDGRGLDVLLQTPEMVLHAPLIFGAYASLCAVFASSASYVMTGERSWHRVALPWGRLAWLTLTAGIGLGAAWAYYVIGWGGYWSWDPVETASLVPWFLLTAFLHTLQRHARKGEYAVASPMFGMFAMAGVVFVSFVVRAGGLWLSSVHDYGVSAGSSAVTRLAALLQDDPAVTGTLVFMIHVIAISSILTLRAARRSGQPSKRPPPERLAGYVTDENNMVLGTTFLLLGALVAVALMVKTVESSQAETAAELNQKMSFLFVAVMGLMSVCLVWRTLGRGRTLVIVAVLAACSVGLGLAAAVSGAFDGLVAFALPMTVFALLVSCMRLVQSLSRGSVARRAFRAGAQMAHLGTALMLCAFFVSSNIQSYPDEGSTVAVAVGAQVSVGDYVVVLSGLSISDEVAGYPAGVVQVRTASVSIREDGRPIEDDARLEVLYGLDTDGGYVVLERVAFVESSLSEDLYLSYEWMSDGVALVHAKVVPMMLPLWVGFVVMLAGQAIRFSVREPLPAEARAGS